MTSETSTARFPSFVADLPITRAALEFAAARHAGQRRDADLAPFILHPLEVAQLLRGRDYPDYVVAAGVLHDVIEDTDADFERPGAALRGAGDRARPVRLRAARGRQLCRAQSSAA